MNLIPLGLLDNRLVDVSEVNESDKGKITCPSCAHELVARKGDVLIHHFAHKAGNGSSEACEYSFFTSVTRAFKENTLKKEIFSLRLPSLKYSKGEFSEVIEKETVKAINAFDIDSNESHGFTFVYLDNGKRVGVSLIWDDASLSPSYELVDKVISINIQALAQKYQEMKLGDNRFSFKELVENFVLYDADRSYTYHSLFDGVKAEIDSRFTSQQEEMHAANFVIDSEPDFSKKRSKYHNIDHLCLICRGDKGSKPLIEDNLCFKCVEKHFYMKGVFRVQEITDIVRATYIPKFIN